jgi:hypothetical protein
MHTTSVMKESNMRIERQKVLQEKPDASYPMGSECEIWIAEVQLYIGAWYLRI